MWSMNNRRKSLEMFSNYTLNAIFFIDFLQTKYSAIMMKKY